MGCSYETAKQKSGIDETTFGTTTSTTSTIIARTRNCNLKVEKIQNNIKFNQQYLIKDTTNNDCQQLQPEHQQQKLYTSKANKTSTATVSKIFKNDSQNKREEFKKKTDFYSLEAKEYINRDTLSPSCHTSALQDTIDFKTAKDENGEVLQESCINCYPLACHNRVCCKQQPHLAAGEIATPTFNPLNYSNAKNSSKSSCSNNNNCRCHLSFFYPKHTKNTLRNEQQCEPNRCHCNCVATQSNDFATFANNCTASGHCLQRTLEHAKASLASNALDLKNNLVEVVGNCATIIESLIGSPNVQYIKQCLNESNSNINCNKNSNNHNKSEPYRGYCQREQQHQSHHLLHEPNYITYSSSISNISSISSSNSCSLHDAISSNSRCNINSNSNINRSSSSGGCNKRNNNRSCSNNYNCHAPSAQTAAFNYIGYNYYHFLRNTINFYTASSVILVLCYLTTPTSAATTKSDTTSIDKHPIQGIDWSKFDESSSDKEILDLLLEKKRYDKRLLPPVNGTLTVNVNVLLLSLASPDESSLKYEVEFLLNQQWNDPRLQYGNKSHYDFLNALHHHDSIWTPDTYFIMHGDFKDPIIPMHFALRIYRNGTITYAMRRHLILSCQGSLHIFPFDDPKCSFSMESISYEEAQIKYVWKNDEDTLRKSPSLTTLNAYLIKNQTTACDQNSWRGNYSCLHVELTFTRDRAYYFTTVFIPGIILVTSSFITFWLEWNAVPARVMIGVTTMLNFFTTSNGFRSTLPVVSNLTAMNVWDGVCMCFIYASLLEFVCVNYMGRKRPQHNVVYRPGENPVTQAAAGISSAGTSMGVTPTPATPSSSEPLTRLHFYQAPSGGIIATAVQNLRSRSIKHRTNVTRPDEGISREVPSHVYEHVYTEPGGITTFSALPTITTTTVTIENDMNDDVAVEKPQTLRRTQSMSTNTPPLICKSSDATKAEIQTEINGNAKLETESKQVDVEQMPIRPPRKKSSRSTSPSGKYEELQKDIIEMMEITGNIGEKKRDAGGPNEIVACTTCGGSSGSPCTHSVNNGCATETCFVQVRKKEPPHPIRIAKTIDVIARITFPTAYAIFLVFFFIHYKGFS